MKILLAVLFSVALIWLRGGTSLVNQNLDNSTMRPAARIVTASYIQPSPEGPTAEVANQAAVPEKTSVVDSSEKQLSPHEEFMREAGIPESDWSAVNYIVSHESSWNTQARNASGAYGLCQALPAKKMASAGDDYMTNPVTQLRWCQSYAHARHGGWWKSVAFWQARVPVNGRDVGNWW